MADRGEAEDLAGGRVGADVPDGGRVDFLAVDSPDDAAVDLDTNPLIGEQLHLTREEAGAGPVNDQPVGVPPEEEGLEHGVEEVGQAPAGRGRP